MSTFQGRESISRKVSGLGASIHGGRPTFALRKVDDEFTLYELLPEDQAVAHKRRWKDNRKLAKHIKIVDTDFVQDTKWEWDTWQAVKIARIDQARFDSVKSLVKAVLQETDGEYEYPELLKPGDRTVLIPEAQGVQLALAFVGIKPLRRVDRQRAFVRQIEGMSIEECYYWHALCRSPSTPNGSKALRTLLTDHIR